MEGSLIKQLFVEKTNKSQVQFFRYIFVGGTATVIDMGSLFVLTSFFHVYYLASAAFAFILGIITNYLMSIAWVFKSTGNLKKEVTLFIAVGIGGLALNELVIWFIVSKLLVFYMIAKAVSAALVLVWNFGMRKKFVFKEA